MIAFLEKRNLFSFKKLLSMIKNDMDFHYLIFHEFYCYNVRIRKFCLTPYNIMIVIITYNILSIGFIILRFGVLLIRKCL